MRILNEEFGLPVLVGYLYPIHKYFILTVNAFTEVFKYPPGQELKCSWYRFETWHYRKSRMLSFEIRLQFVIEVNFAEKEIESMRLNWYKFRLSIVRTHRVVS